MAGQLVELGSELDCIQRAGGDVARNVMEDVFVQTIDDMETFATFRGRPPYTSLVMSQVEHLVWIPLVVES